MQKILQPQMKPQLTPFDDAGSKAGLTREWLLTPGNHRQKKSNVIPLSRTRCGSREDQGGQETTSAKGQFWHNNKYENMGLK